MTDKVQKIREEVERMHNLLPVMDGDNISVNYADRICTTLEMYIDSLQEEAGFKVGDTLRRKSDGCYAKVIEVKNGNVRVESTDWDMWILNKEWELVEEPASEEFEEALAREWQGYNERGAAMVDALEDNTQELAFAKGFYRGSKWQEEKDNEEKVLIYKHGFDDCKEHIKEVLLSEVLPCFMHGGEADEVVAKLEEVLNKK